MTRSALYVMLALLSVTALGGGAALMLRPDGSSLGMSTAQLATSLFRDFRWPGVVLFTLFGGGSAIALFGVATHRRWGARWAMAIGAMQVVWILVQVVMIKDPSVLQAVFLSVGIAITALAAYANGYSWGGRGAGGNSD